MWLIFITVLLLPLSDSFRSVANSYNRLHKVSVVRNYDDSLTVTTKHERISTAIEPTSNVFHVNVTDRTYNCLDFQIILDSLRDTTVTVLGKEMVFSHEYSNDIYIINNLYAQIDQLMPNLENIPLRNTMNVWPVLRAIEINSSPPEQDDLANFADIIEEIQVLETFLSNNANDKLTLFQSIQTAMFLPEEFIQIFHNSFDDESNLNSEKYPLIKKLRLEAELLRSKIIQTIKSLLNNQDMKEKIADSGYQEIDGRFCLMLKNTYKKGVGIVHGSSNTGRSLYVEPMELVEPTNEMKSIFAQLKAEENRIFFEMCKSISKYRDEIRQSVGAIAELDLLMAKAKLGNKLKGVIPEVSNEGKISCYDAKHPILLLRGTNAVGNKIELDSSTISALVISGPNAGGKTIVLKTAGLFALMVKYAIPIPAKFGARVDIFNVMADIGDMQSVSIDLSTFSGHLCTCREMLVSAKEFNGKSLVLLDEIGTGTDPAQGAALAQAILEEFLTLGARVIVTTHYQRVKELAAEDRRFEIAAMEFIDNRPTYKLRVGFVGESYALETGERMKLPTHVITRANSLLDDESRRLINLQKKLEEETELARQKQSEFERFKDELASRESSIEKAKLMVEEQIAKLREGKTYEFIEDLKIKEVEMETLIRRAEEIATSSDMKRVDKEKAIEDIKNSMKNVRIGTEKAIVEDSTDDIATPLVPGEPIDEGTTLIVLERGSIFGSRGIVTQRNKGRGRVLIRVGGVEIKMERHLLGVPKVKGILGFVVNGKVADDKTSNLSSKDRRMLKMLEEELVDPDRMTLSKSDKKGVSNVHKDGVIGGLRRGDNTLDLTKCISETQAQESANKFIEKMIDNSVYTMYIYLGKDPKIDKNKFRGWLKKHPFVRKAETASASDGGESYTILALHTLE